MRVLSSAQIDELMEAALSPIPPPDKTKSQQEQDKQQNDALKTKMMAAEMCKKNLADVSALVQKAAQVRSLATDAATVDDIQFVIDQVLAVIRQTVEPVDPILSISLVKQIEQVKMPNRARDLPDASALLVRAVEEISQIQAGRTMDMRLAEEGKKQAEENAEQATNQEQTDGTEPK